MRLVALFTLALCLGFATGCGKKPAPPEEQPKSGPGPTPDAKADPANTRTKLLAGLKGAKQESKRYSIEELSWLAEDDPAVLPALVELLTDKSNSGSGRTLANQVNSTREAAALTIMICTNGEKVMKEQGLPILREGLRDPSPAVREHTAYTIGLIGSVAKPLAGDVQKLCTDPDANVRGAAFDALRVLGVADPVALVKLLLHKDEEVVRLAAGLVPLVSEMPEDAVPPLVEALGKENSNVRATAAEGLAVAGPKAAPAVPKLIEIINKSYPAVFDPKAPTEGTEVSFWKALARIGEPAVAPTAKLLEHTNVLVRALAANTLGEIGPAAKAAKDALKKALGDDTIDVASEAAVALCILGEGKQDVTGLMKRALDAPNGRVAMTAIQNIPRMGDTGKEFMPLALAKMADPNPNTRYAAMWLVSQLPPAEAAKSAADVGKLATDEFPEIRRDAGRVLEKLGPNGAPAADALGKAIATESDLGIRNQFVETLIAMGEGAKPALPAMLPLLSDSSVDVQLRAKVAAAVVVADPISPEVVAALVKAASDKDQTARIAAATAMGKLQLNPLPPDALNTLVKLAKGDEKLAVRDAAVQAIATAGPRAKAAKPELEAITAGKLEGLTLWAKVGLAAIDGNANKAAPDIRAGLAARNSQARAAATQALLIIGPTKADLPILLKLLRDANSATKAASALAVGQLGVAAKEAVPLLVRLLDDGDYQTQIAAANALGQIGPDARMAIRKLKELSLAPLTQASAQRAIDKIEKK